jgi:DinB superfamily
MTSCCERIQQVIHAALEGMTREQLAWRPAGKWSAADVLEHLTLTYKGTKIGGDRCLAAGKPLARNPSMADRLRTFVVVTLGYLPGGRQAPEGTRPTGINSGSALEEFDQQLAAMDRAIESCDERFGSRKKLMNHPIIGPLTVSEWRKFHLVHARHHARQIAMLKSNLQGKR